MLNLKSSNFQFISRVENDKKTSLTFLFIFAAHLNY